MLSTVIPLLGAEFVEGEFALGSLSALADDVEQISVADDRFSQAPTGDADPSIKGVAASLGQPFSPSFFPSFGRGESSEWLTGAIANSLPSQDSDADAAVSKTLILVGGSWEYPATEDPYGVSIYLDILERAGGVDGAKIGIFTTASSSARSARENGQLYVQDFEDLYDLYLKDQYPDAKIDVEWIPFHVGNCERKEDSEKLLKQIKSRNAFIFGGGDQSLLTECFFDDDPTTGKRTETPVFRALKRTYEKGAIVAGTSAGTTVQTDSPMITEGESYETVLNGSTPLIGTPPFVRDGFYHPLGGFGFFNYGLLDTHFSERGRQGRIIRLASDVGVETTYGVDENTALIVTDADTPDVQMSVLGQGGVYISNLSEAVVDTSSGNWSITGVKGTYLTEGDRYDPLTNRARFRGKTRLDTPADPATELVAENIFSWKDPDGSWTDPRTFTQLGVDLFQSTAKTGRGFSFEADPQYEVTMTRNGRARGFIGEDSLGVERVSFANLDISIAPNF